MARWQGSSCSSPFVMFVSPVSPEVEDRREFWMDEERVRIFPDFGGGDRSLLQSLFAQGTQPELDLTDLAQQVNKGQVERMVVSGEEVKVYYKDSREAAVTRKERNSDIVQTLVALGVPSDKIMEVGIQVEKPSDWGSWLTILSGILPLIFVGALFYFLMRQAQGATARRFRLGKAVHGCSRVINRR